MSALMRDHIQPIAAKIVPGKRITWHTMRRTYASLLQAHNDDAKVVQELLRHASFSITMNIYAQAVTKNKRAAQSKVVEMVASSMRDGNSNHERTLAAVGDEK
jgi:integrase